MLVMRLAIWENVSYKMGKKMKMLCPIPSVFLLYMLMYGKEARNRKQEIDRQRHIIPNQRPKDKHCGNLLMRDILK